MKLNTDTSRLDKFLDAVAQKETVKPIEGVEYWPLNPTELLGYIDAEFIRDFYLRLQDLRKNGYSIEELTPLFRDNAILLEVLVAFACMGFKVLERFDIYKISIDERLDFFNAIFDIIEEKEKDFSFSKNSKIFLNEEKVNKILNSDLIKVNESNKSILNGYKVANFALNWSLYYDLLAVFGWYFHGPYRVKIKEGEFLMLADEYHNRNLRDIWPKSKELPFKENI